MRSADSIAANIAEGYGRYLYRESMVFSRSLLLETIAWLTKTKNRSLISETEFNVMSEEINILHKKLNTYISYIKSLKERE